VSQTVVPAAPGPAAPVAGGVERRRHLLGIADLGRDEIEHLLTLTDSFVEVSRRRMPKVPALQGRTVSWLFYEDSTRTRLSFEQAAKRLSADTLSFSVSTSSVNKGESVRDTV
jgi:aspartate carbamoyltransferase catalytic subunit